MQPQCANEMHSLERPRLFPHHGDSLLLGQRPSIRAVSSARPTTAASLLEEAIGGLTPPIRSTHPQYARRRPPHAPDTQYARPGYAVRIRNTQYAGAPTPPIRNTHPQYARRRRPHATARIRYAIRIRNTQDAIGCSTWHAIRPGTQYADAIRNTQYAFTLRRRQTRCDNAQYAIRNTHSLSDGCEILCQYAIRRTQCAGGLRVCALNTQCCCSIRSSQYVAYTVLTISPQYL